jgi:glycosyltransferase involved in cell wall biosynthesis
MSVYNGERFLEEAVESILDQSLAELELIVIDDGSTDGTAEILSTYATSDPRVVVRAQPNEGRAAALNRGLGLARAPLVARLDADDVALPGRLERQRRFLAEHERVAVVGGAVTFIDDEGRPFGDWRYPLTDVEIRRAFDTSTPLVHPAVMMRADAVKAVGGYRPVFEESEDVDLWLRLAAAHELANVPELVLRYRVHDGQASFRQLELQTFCSVAARLAARERSEGRPDPFASGARIDRRALVSLGVAERELTAALVRKATWLGKAMGRAGYSSAADALLAQALTTARSPSGSPALTASVYRAHGEILRAAGRPARAALMTARGRGASLRERLGQRREPPP